MKFIKISLIHYFASFLSRCTHTHTYTTTRAHALLLQHVFGIWPFLLQKWLLRRVFPCKCIMMQNGLCDYVFCCQCEYEFVLRTLPHWLVVVFARFDAIKHWRKTRRFVPSPTATACFADWLTDSYYYYRIHMYICALRCALSRMYIILSTTNNDNNNYDGDKTIGNKNMEKWRQQQHSQCVHKTYTMEE